MPMVSWKKNRRNKAISGWAEVMFCWWKWNSEENLSYHSFLVDCHERDLQR